ncbi:MAG: sugar phosphate isomerase/epimerase [Oscillospiraceae bacterium]|nr:sugar phosphate isomerase/epimerase [Oscillospiraceae bacterium]
MKTAVSNIAWPAEMDTEMLAYIRSLGFEGLEVAPTRLFPDAPYEKTEEAGAYAAALYEQYHLRVCSMQSILFGVTQNFFVSEEERKFLDGYLRRAIDFAGTIGCGNLVFGCPKNRIIQDAGQYGIAVEFFRSLGEYAATRGTVLSVEPNPVIYGTNFLNTTAEAFRFVREVAHPGCMVNVDMGTMIYNEEPFVVLEQNAKWIRHIHLSEPNLVPIRPRELHKQLKSLPYDGYLSLEMKNTGDAGTVRAALDYLRGVAV